MPRISPHRQFRHPCPPSRPLFALTRPISAEGNTNNAGERGLVTYDAFARSRVRCALAVITYSPSDVTTKYRLRSGSLGAYFLHVIGQWVNPPYCPPPTNLCEMRRPRRGHCTGRDVRKGEACGSVQGRAKKILLSSVTHVPSGLMGSASAALS